MLPLLLFLPSLVSSQSDKIIVSRHLATYRFRQGETLQLGDQIIVEFRVFNIEDKFVISMYKGCDIPLRLTFLPHMNKMQVASRRDGKLSGPRLMDVDLREDGEFQVNIYVQSGRINVGVNEKDIAKSIQVRVVDSMEDLSHITVSGKSIDRPAVRVEHVDPKNAAIAESHAPHKGPNY